MQDLDLSTDPSHGRTMNPTIVLDSGWVWMSPLPQRQYGPETPTCPLISVVYTGFDDDRCNGHHTDPDCSRVTDPDMGLSCSSGPEDIMTLSSRHSDRDASWPSDFYLDSGGWASLWHFVVTGAQSIGLLMGIF